MRNRGQVILFYSNNEAQADAVPEARDEERHEQGQRRVRLPLKCAECYE
jgi:hypothetical protein